MIVNIQIFCLSSSFCSCFLFYPSLHFPLFMFVFLYYFLLLTTFLLSESFVYFSLLFFFHLFLLFCFCVLFCFHECLFCLFLWLFLCLLILLSGRIIFFRSFCFQKMQCYVESMSNEPFVLYGESGSGKTSIMSMAAMNCQIWTKKQTVTVLR